MPLHNVISNFFNLLFPNLIWTDLGELKGSSMLLRMPGRRCTRKVTGIQDLSKKPMICACILSITSWTYYGVNVLNQRHDLFVIFYYLASKIGQDFEGPDGEQDNLISASLYALANLIDPNNTKDHDWQERFRKEHDRYRTKTSQMGTTTASWTFKVVSGK